MRRENTESSSNFTALIEASLQARELPQGAAFVGALRLFNGFYEGLPGLILELYGSTLVVIKNQQLSGFDQSNVLTMIHPVLVRFPWMKTILFKDRSDARAEVRKGILLFGDSLTDQVVEWGVNYALDLTLNQDTGFYLDTSFLRAWLKTHAAGWQVCNLFAYTGTLGVAALAGGAAQVMQVDRNPRFLRLSEASLRLNRIPRVRQQLAPVDFFTFSAQCRQTNQTFDAVILDPPFFSKTSAGRVDQAQETERAINKARPLVRDGGRLIVVNNALYLSGADYMRKLEALGTGGFVQVEEIIPVPEDCTGYASTRVGTPPVDPAPFNHPTKIVILRIKRK